MSDETPDPASVVVYRYVGDGDQHLLGVPMRDVTAADWDQMEEAAKADLLVHAKRSDGLYEQTMTLEEARQVDKLGKREAAKRAQAQPEKAVRGGAKKGASKKGAKRRTQTDPDVLTPGRVDSDVVAQGQAVPPPDEPIGEGAPGFLKADTGPGGAPTSPQEG